MKPPRDSEIWTPARLKARLAALKGLAPAPGLYVIWRSTAQPRAKDVHGYELPGIPGRVDETAFEQFLADRGLAGADRLSVSVLVIRERLDQAGLIREAVLERRRGGIDGPYYGNVARIEFSGPAAQVRRYRAQRDGRLAELPEQDDPGAPLPPAEPDADGYAGEDAAVLAALGRGTLIVDRRPPGLFEDLLGLSVIIHARRPDGAEIGCGVGWHGGIAFVLMADFPRRDAALLPPPDLEAAAEAAVRTHDLIRHETRRDERGFAVMARMRGESSLVIIRLDGATTHIEPYFPGRTAAANDDQRRWMTYAETYEAREVIDSWRDGDGDEIAVLTVDPDQQAWRHIIDADGVELSRQSDNEAAVAVLYRERMNPPDQVPPPRDTGAGDVTPEAVPAAVPDEYEAPDDSLLTKVLAWSRASSLLGAAIAGARGGDQTAVPEQLTGLLEPLTTLHAGFSLGSARRLIARLETGRLSSADLAASLTDLVARLCDELALTRIVALPATSLTAEGEPPFGPLVELHFPAAMHDIEEAAQCLALRRATASVFHAMKVMRYGLRETQHLLSSPGLTELPWADMISVVRDAPGDHRDLAEALTRVRRVWRATGLTPADRYGEAEAEAVLVSVAAFMRLLAAKLDVLGERAAG